MMHAAVIHFALALRLYLVSCCKVQVANDPKEKFFFANDPKEKLFLLMNQKRINFSFGSSAKIPSAVGENGMSNRLICRLFQHVGEFVRILLLVV